MQCLLPNSYYDNEVNYKIMIKVDQRSVLYGLNHEYSAIK